MLGRRAHASTHTSFMNRLPGRARKVRAPTGRAGPSLSSPLLAKAGVLKGLRISGASMTNDPPERRRTALVRRRLISSGSASDMLPRRTERTSLELSQPCLCSDACRPRACIRTTAMVYSAQGSSWLPDGLTDDKEEVQQASACNNSWA